MQRSMPVLQVKDVEKSAAFYGQLGFRSHGFWGDPPAFCIIQRGNVTIALDRSEDGNVPKNQWWAAYIYVDDADALHGEWAALGVEVTEPYNQEYGCRDFDLIDIDGHRIAFGTDLEDVDRPGLAG